MKCRIIKSPSSGAVDILIKRSSPGNQPGPTEKIGAIGLIQGLFIEMVCAADIAEKAANVTAVDIRGNCPQNMLLLALFGDTASVEAAIEEIRRNEQGVHNYGGSEIS